MLLSNLGPVSLTLAMLLGEPPVLEDAVPAETSAEVYLDETGREVTLDEVVASCDSDGCTTSSVPGHFGLFKRVERSSGLGLWGKVKGWFQSYRWTSGWRGRHHAAVPTGECGDICECTSDLCDCGDGCETSDDCSCGEVVETGESSEEVPVESTAAPCPACQHVIAPSPAVRVVPVTEELSTSRPMATPSVSEEPVTNPTKHQETVDPNEPSKLVPTEPSSKDSTRHQGVDSKVRPIAYMPEATHAEDYSWLEGTLQYQHSRGGVWVIRYLPFDQTDERGGQAILLKDARLNGFCDGDRVRVEGRWVQAGPRTPATYRVSSIAHLRDE